VQVETEIGHSFRKELPIAEVKRCLGRGQEPGPVQDWAT
jgi:hypothetical protein